MGLIHLIVVTDDLELVPNPRNDEAWGIIIVMLFTVTAKQVDEAGQAHRPNTNQCIISLDMDLWKV